jgi:hypothetical protein
MQCLNGFRTQFRSVSIYIVCVHVCLVLRFSVYSPSPSHFIHFHANCRASKRCSGRLRTRWSAGSGTGTSSPSSPLTASESPPARSRYACRYLFLVQFVSNQRSTSGKYWVSRALMIVPAVVVNAQCWTNKVTSTHFFSPFQNRAMFLTCVLLV